MSDLLRLGCYHSDISMEEAESLLSDKTAGTYLIRPTSSRRPSVVCTLSMKINPSDVRHLRIKRDKVCGELNVDGCSQTSVGFLTVLDLLLASTTRGLLIRNLTRNSDCYGSTEKIRVVLGKPLISSHSDKMWKTVL